MNKIITCLIFFALILLSFGLYLTINEDIGGIPYLVVGAVIVNIWNKYDASVEEAE